MKNFKYILFSMFFISLTSFIKLVNDEDLKHFENEDYEISYPNNWKCKTSKGLLKLTMTSPLSSIKDKFAENVNLVLEDVSEYDLTLDEYAEMSIKNLSLLYKIKMINETMDESHGHDYHEILYFAKVQKQKVVLCQRTFLKEGIAYILTFCFEKKTYTDYLDEKDLIFNSFKLK